MMSTVLKCGNSSFDLSDSVTEWEITVKQSWKTQTLLNGKLKTCFDLGRSGDKYSSKIEIQLPLSKAQNFETFYQTTKGKILTLETDLDFFEPNCYKNLQTFSVMITAFSLTGNSFDFSQNLMQYKIEILNLEPYYYSSVDASSVLSRGIWERTFSASDIFNLSERSTDVFPALNRNFTNNLSCTWNSLTKTDANKLFRFLCYYRSSEIAVMIPGCCFGDTGSHGITVKIKDFTFKKNKLFYDCSLSAVQN